MRELISKFGERRKRIVMLSQAVAPLGTWTSFANHNVSWMHNSNYILLRTARRKYNEALPFTFSNNTEHLKKSIFISEMCRFSEDCQSPQINRLVTTWQIRRWPFTVSDLIVSWIRFIRPSLNLTALLLQIQYISQTVADCLIQSSQSFYRCGSRGFVRCGNQSGLNSPIHACTLVVKVKESSWACVIVDLRFD